MSSESDHEERLRIAADARRKFDSARVLVRQLRFQEALECYLFAFDNGALVDGWGGVRLSYIPAEIAELGKSYPQALLELRARRDLREDRILNGSTEFSVVQEWSSLNRYLNDSERELGVIKKLTSEGKLDESTKSFIMRSHVDELMKEGDADAINEFINDEGRGLFLHIQQYELNVLFPAGNSGKKEFYKRDKQRVEDSGTKVYGMLLVASRFNDADELERVLLELMPTKEMYAGLIFGAQAVGSSERLARLWELAHAALKKEEVHWIEEWISKVFSK